MTCCLFSSSRWTEKEDSALSDVSYVCLPKDILVTLSDIISKRKFIFFLSDMASTVSKDIPEGDLAIRGLRAWGELPLLKRPAGFLIQSRIARGLDHDDIRAYIAFARHSKRETDGSHPAFFFRPSGVARKHLVKDSPLAGFAQTKAQQISLGELMAG